MDKSKLQLRVGNPECSRLVAFLGQKGKVVGAGCLISADTVLTCSHVVQAALGSRPLVEGSRIHMILCGLDKPLKVEGFFECRSTICGPAGDVAKVRIDLPSNTLAVANVEFAEPFRHGGKVYSVIGFPEGNPDGYYASGIMRGANVAGLVQLDGESKILVQPGFSGAPVWSSELNAYVGIVVSVLEDNRVAWCIPSRILCQFYHDLPVRYRVSRPDRPDVHDFGEDDPNIPLFGNVSDNGKRRFSVTGIEKEAQDKVRVDIRYECLHGRARGRYVTFITHPSFSRAKEDAYELFSEIEEGVATNYFWAGGAFTVAAVGDGGDTALTYNIAKFPGRPKEMA